MPTQRKLSQTDNPINPDVLPVTGICTPSPRPKSNTQLLIDLLASDTGATIGQITNATGWLPHSARAALTGLRKTGHTIARISSDGSTTYRIVEREQ